jgi:hypothetical protein
LASLVEPLDRDEERELGRGKVGEETLVEGPVKGKHREKRVDRMAVKKMVETEEHCVEAKRVDGLLEDDVISPGVDLLGFLDEEQIGEGRDRKVDLVEQEGSGDGRAEERDVRVARVVTEKELEGEDNAGTYPAVIMETRVGEERVALEQEEVERGSTVVIEDGLEIGQGIVMDLKDLERE